MEVIKQEVQLGKLKLELSVRRVRANMLVSFSPLQNFYHVYLTARDQKDCRLWTTPILSKQGHIKYYSSVEEAMDDALSKLKETTFTNP